MYLRRREFLKGIAGVPFGFQLSRTADSIERYQYFEKFVFDYFSKSGLDLGKMDDQSPNSLVDKITKELAQGIEVEFEGHKFKVNALLNSPQSLELVADGFYYMLDNRVNGVDRFGIKNIDSSNGHQPYKFIPLDTSTRAGRSLDDAVNKLQVAILRVLSNSADTSQAISEYAKAKDVVDKILKRYT